MTDTDEQAYTFRLLQERVKKTGNAQPMMRPAKLGRGEEGVQQPCPKCGVLCWILADEPPQLPADVYPMCERCSESMRKDPIAVSRRDS